MTKAQLETKKVTLVQRKEELTESIKEFQLQVQKGKEKVNGMILELKTIEERINFVDELINVV